MNSKLGLPRKLKTHYGYLRGRILRLDNTRNLNSKLTLCSELKECRSLRGRTRRRSLQGMEFFRAGLRESMPTHISSPPLRWPQEEALGCRYVAVEGRRQIHNPHPRWKIRTHWYLQLPPNYT